MAAKTINPFAYAKRDFQCADVYSPETTSVA